MTCLKVVDDIRLFAYFTKNDKIIFMQCHDVCNAFHDDALKINENVICVLYVYATINDVCEISLKCI